MILCGVFLVIMCCFVVPLHLFVSFCGYFESLPGLYVLGTESSSVQVTVCVSPFNQTDYGSLKTCLKFEIGKGVNIVSVMLGRAPEAGANRLKALEPMVIKRADGDGSWIAPGTVPGWPVQ